MVFCRGNFDAQTRGCRIETEPATGQNPIRPSFAYVVRVFLVCLGLWTIPIGALWIWRGYNDTLMQIGLFFTKAAFVTFGGAYAVLSYITDVSVTKGWLGMQQMLIGLGLAESTPGPLIMVTQYVGFRGAWNLAVWFGLNIIFPNSSIDFLALISAIVSLVLLQKFHLPIHYLVPGGAASGVIWRIVV